jgi:hypothetical protein
MLRLGLVLVPGSQDVLRTPGALIGLDSFPGRLAQLGERRLDKAEVTGSSPVSPTVGFGSRARIIRTQRSRLVAIW